MFWYMKNFFEVTWLECYGSSKLSSEKPLYALFCTFHIFSMRVHWPQMTPQNKSTMRLSLWFPDDFTSIRHCQQQLLVPTAFFGSVCVAPRRNAWPFCEQAEERRQPGEEGGVISDRDRPLPWSHSIARDLDLSSLSQSFCSYPVNIHLL